MPLPAFLSAHATTVQALFVTGLAPSPPPLLAVYTLVLDGGGEMADDPPPFSSSSRFIASLSPTLPSEFVAMDFQVVVLAGGAFKNLAPLVSEEIPKALLPVANRPVLELLESSNLKDLIVVVELPFGDLGPKDVCTPENQELARDAARQGIVLLKNNKGTLPLSTKTIKSLAIIGPNANASYTMIGNYEGIPCKYTTPLQGLSAVITSSVYQSGCQNVACSSNSLQLDPAKKATAGADATILIELVSSSLASKRHSLPRWLR